MIATGDAGLTGGKKRENVVWPARDSERASLCPNPGVTPGLGHIFRLETIKPGSNSRV